MRPHVSAILPTLLLAFALTPPARAADEAAVLRFALVVGANDGGQDRVRLRYAHADAESMAGVLEELGGIGPSDRVLVLDPDGPALEAAFGRLAEIVDRARTDNRRTELVFYYSGHSDEQGLLLSGERYPYAVLRGALDAVGADVRVAILDSCASGALTLGKGGLRRPPFLVDASTRVEGYAFLTSASADEAAQESESLQGSFFTHYLVSGLRGAADVTPDGRITLNEAYQYAFQETLARTESTRVGAQHPNYDINLAGRGELVLTDLRETSATLALAREVEGRLFVRDARGRLVAEVNKLAGRPMRLGLQPGEYQVGFETPSGLHRGRLVLTEGQITEFSADALDAVALEDTVTRGGPARGPEAGDPDGPAPELAFVPAAASVWLRAGTDAWFARPARNAFRLNLLVGGGDALAGLEISSLGGVLRAPSAGAQLAGLFNLTGPFSGLQIGGLLNGSAELTGLQVGGLLNRSADLAGLQVGGLLNRSADLAGLQIGGLLNVAAGVTGAQLGTVNVSGPLHGVQVGVVNVAGPSRGFMLGVVNVADSLDGLPIGLVNVIRDGLFEVGAFATEHSALNLTLKSGSSRAYTVFGVGLHTHDSEPVLRSILGVGLHFGDRLWLDTDLTTTGSSLIDAGGLWQASGVDLVTSLRLAVGLRVLGPVSIFAGPTLNLLVSRAREAPVSGLVLWSRTEGDVNLAVWPGLAVGLQL